MAAVASVENLYEKDAGDVSGHLMKQRGFIGRLAGGVPAGTAGLCAAQEQSVAASLVRTSAVVMACGKVEWQDADGSTGTAAADRFGFVPQGEEFRELRCL